MPEDAEKMKRLVSFKTKLEERAQKLDSELKEVETMLETVNSLLLEKGFKRLEIPKETLKAETTGQEEPMFAVSERASPLPPASSESVTELKTTDGELLAELYVSENGDSANIVPAGDKRFDVNTPPFTQFLIERILLKMQERDNELAKTGHLTLDRIFCYDIAREGDVIKQITVKNIDSERLKELKSSIRWTFEKMYEKMKRPS
jgi:hypothetical protein